MMGTVHQIYPTRVIPLHRGALVDEVRGEPVDYPVGVRFVDPADMARAMGDAEMLAAYGSPEEQARIARVIADTERDLRVMRWQRRIGLACWSLAALTAIYMLAQLVRGAL